MGNKSKTLSDPLVVNVNGELMAAVASLKKRFGLSNLSIVMKNGKYFLDVDGQLIEITFVNGKIIPADVFENLNARLEALLEQNGFEPLTLNELPTAAISQEELAHGLALFSFASIGILAHHSSRSGDTQNPPAQSPATQTNEGPIPFDAAGRAYTLITEPMTFAAAQDYAARNGSRLVSFSDTSDYNDFYNELKHVVTDNEIALTTAPDGGGAEYVWLGATDQVDEGYWDWENGQGLSLDAPQWGSSILGSEPDDYENQDGLALGMTDWPFGAAGEWNDVDLNNKLAFVIEGIHPSTEGASATDTQQSGNDRSDGTIVLESINNNAQNDTIVLDYNQRLNQNIRPTRDDFEVFINNVPALVSRISINDDKVILEFDQDILSGDSVQLTYKDQNGDTQNSIQNVDGDLAAAFIQGIVIDGYIAGAQMFIDKDDDGIPDPDELLEGITTGADGRFIMDGSLNPEGYPLLITGGTNVDTGLANNTVLTAPAGSTVITPTTTLIQTMVRNGLVANVDEAAETIIKAGGFDPNTVELLNFDPISAIKNDPQNAAAMALHKANTSIVQIIESVGTENSGAINAQLVLAATAKVAELMVGQSASTDPADWLALSDAVVNSVLGGRSGGRDGLSLQTKKKLGKHLKDIQEATSLEDIANAQIGVVVTLDSYYSSTPFVTNDQTPVITGSATPGSTVTIVIQNGLLPEDPSATYEVTAAADGMPTLVDGTVYELTRWSVDTGTLDPVAGTLSLNDFNMVSATATKLGITSAPKTSQLEIDTTAPIANLAVLDDFGGVQGELSDGDTTDDSQLYLWGTTDDSHHYIDSGSTVQVFDGTTLLGNAEASFGYWDYIAAIEDGTTYAFNAKETDLAGNTSAPTASITITGDRTAPSAPVLALATDTNVNGDGINSDATVDVTGIETNATWEYSVNGGTDWTAGSGASFEVAEGTYVDGDVKVRQTDVAGNVSSTGMLADAITFVSDVTASYADVQDNGDVYLYSTVTGANIYAEKQDGTQRSLNVITDNTGRFILEETELKKIESNNEIIVAKDGYDILVEKPQLFDYKAELGKELNFFDTISAINTDVSSTNLLLKGLFEELKLEVTSSEIDLLAKNKAYDEPMIDLLKSISHITYLWLENELELAQRLDQSIQPIAFYKAWAEGSLPKILGQNYDTYLELSDAYYETPEFGEFLFYSSIEMSNVVKQIDDLWENPETVRELQRKDMLDWYEDKAYLIGIDFDGDEKYLGKNEARLTTESIQQFTIGDESSDDNTVSFWFDISQLTAGSSITLITTDGVVAESNPISQSDINKEIYQFSAQNGKTVFELQNDNSNTDLGLYIDGTKIDGLESSSEEDMLEDMSTVSNYINEFSIVAFKTVNDGNEYLDGTIYEW